MRILFSPLVRSISIRIYLLVDTYADQRMVQVTIIQMFYCAFDKKFNVIYFKSTFIISLYIYSLTHTPTQETVTKRTHILNVTYYNITSKREVKIPDQNKNLLILIVILPVVGLLITIILFILFKKRSKLL